MRGMVEAIVGVTVLMLASTIPVAVLATFIATILKLLKVW